MTWATEDGKHEGFVSCVMRDGSLSVGSGGGPDGGAFVLTPPVDGDWAAALAASGDTRTVDGRDAVGWRGVCGCGWLGPLWVRVHRVDQADAGQRRVLVYDPDPDRYGSEPPSLEEAVHVEWLDHLAPDEALNGVRIAAQAAGRALEDLDDAVRGARVLNLSWAAIGAAAGISRQSAHERWARKTEPPGLPGSFLPTGEELPA